MRLGDITYLKKELARQGVISAIIELNDESFRELKDNFETLTIDSGSIIYENTSPNNTRGITYMGITFYNKYDR